MKAETELRNAIRDALLASGVYVMTNAQVGRTHHGGLGPGSADLVAIVRGRFVGLEVKVPGGKPQPNQRAWGELVEAHGGRYVVVTSVREALDAVREVQEKSLPEAV